MSSNLKFKSLENVEKLIKASIKGKASAQKKLYNLFADKMFGVCLLYTKDYDAAKDVMQDGFIKVFGKLESFKFSGSFEGWVRRIMVNTALERYRKNHFLYAVSDVEDYKDNLSYDDMMDSFSANDILKLVKELTPQYQMVFTLYAIEGYSHKEIAQKMGISEGTSKSNLSRARKILQEKVRIYFNAGEDKRVVEK